MGEKTAQGGAQIRRVILLGFMASGKSAVGERLAERLGWAHVDLDRHIERQAGRTVAEIFAAEGEAAFRALEVEVTPGLLARDRLVLSPGGGWVTNPGVFDRLDASTLTVWLRVSPAVVLRRLAATDQPVRPLLQSPSPEARIAELLAARDPIYRRAAAAIDTDDRTVEQIVELILQEMESRQALSPQPDTTS